MAPRSYPLRFLSFRSNEFLFGVFDPSINHTNWDGPKEELSECDATLIDELHSALCKSESLQVLNFESEAGRDQTFERFEDTMLVPLNRNVANQSFFDHHNSMLCRQNRFNNKVLDSLDNQDKTQSMLTNVKRFLPSSTCLIIDCLVGRFAVTRSSSTVDNPNTQLVQPPKHYFTTAYRMLHEIVQHITNINNPNKKPSATKGKKKRGLTDIDYETYEQDRRKQAAHWKPPQPEPRIERVVPWRPWQRPLEPPAFEYL